MKTTVKTPVGRMGWISLVSPSTNSDSAKYQLTLYIPKGEKWDEGCKELRQLVLATGREFFKKPNAKLSDFKNPFRDTDENEKIEESLKGHYCFSMSSKYKPTIINAATEKMSDEEVARIKNGDYCRCVVTAYGYKNKGNTGVALGMQLVQFSHAGKPLAGGGLAANIQLLGELDVEVEDIEEDVEEAPKATKQKQAKKKPIIEDVYDEADDLMV